MLPTKFQVNSLLDLGEAKKKKDFQDGHYGCILDFRSAGFFLAIFALQVTLILPTKFRVKWPFG